MAFCQLLIYCEGTFALAFRLLEPVLTPVVPLETSCVRQAHGRVSRRIGSVHRNGFFELCNRALNVVRMFVVFQVSAAAQVEIVSGRFRIQILLHKLPS